MWNALTDLISTSLIAQNAEGSDINFISLAFHSGFVVGSVLILLIFFSIASWAIILYKYFTLLKAHQQSVFFLNLFWESNSLSQVFDGSEKFGHSPVAQVFRAGYIELAKSVNAQKPSREPGDMENIERALRRAASHQVTTLESLVSFLATTGSTAPFVGLFGTVWGIMESFHEIGRVGNATLATVAPGISEALIATATGLFAAIPAVVGYNYFVQRIKVLDAEMGNFSIDFINIIKRRFF